MQALGYAVNLVAVNHWDVAIATHSANHPGAAHHCVNLDAARPEDLVPNGHLDLLMASPECTFFSRARGGKPIQDQRRMSAWHVQRWVSTLDVRCILVENVPEFQFWGPLDEQGRPDRSKRGLYFQSWITALMGMGYDVDWRTLNAADFGDATTRTRFFLQARKDGQPIRWPEPSHAPEGKADLFSDRPRWRPARDVIEWNKPGRSIFNRRKPLSVKTRLRIARGLDRFGGILAPFYVQLLDLPDVASLVGGGNSFVAKPFVLGQQGGSVARATTEPLPTITTGGAISLIDPQIVPYYRTSQPCSVDGPLPTITTHDRFALCEPVCEPFIVPQFGERDGQAPRIHDLDDPLPVVTSHGAGCLVEPVIESTVKPTDAPRVVLIDGRAHQLDIRFRMLTNRELARAMGFEDGEQRYEFHGSASQVTTQIGNAVACHTAEALVRALLAPYTA
jgi:DNA (cytosine-5)-methyltransferase 1